MSPNLIVLDGASGAGKTTLAKALQEQFLPENWLYFSIDTLVYSLPPSVFEHCNQENDWRSLDPNTLIKGAFSCVNALLEAGNKVIFDAVISTPQGALQMDLAFENHERLYVGLHCELTELERRTFDRGDRTIDEARHGFSTSPFHLKYDLELDSTSTPATELSTIIAATLQERVSRHKQRMDT
ncbi:Chloramphenicol 3-O phosphotransferase [Grimontia marina]|uniref:Chloramphenicol 3-O phosphotransferase n=2 Tax=Grimontia marina TaxID=646534 RepID=A0A128EZC6_9GAMM|nr:AAA family ATPase [Grimontia marina]CZF79500.1 Chloramphenicol 3-O phosphotransferase [Grimontia marina]